MDRKYQQQKNKTKRTTRKIRNFQHSKILQL